MPEARHGVGVEEQPEALPLLHRRPQERIDDADVVGGRGRPPVLTQADVMAGAQAVRRDTHKMRAFVRNSSSKTLCFKKDDHRR